MKNKIIIFLLIILTLTGCKEKTYTVSFDTLGGNVLESININQGETLKNIENPIKDGYLFVKWLKDGIEYNFNNPITEDIQLTASWIEAPEIYNYYKITFISEGKTEKTTVKENDLVEEAIPEEKENHIFIGWYVGEEKFDFNTKITKDLTLIAKYELNIVTITYELDGGLGLTLETIPKNSTIPIPTTPTKIGHKFLKWTYNNKEFNFDTKIKENITLKAVWEEITYIQVTFDTDGGNEIPTKTIEKYTKLKELPIPTKEGYQFIEWRLNDEIFNVDTIIENNITLKAIYQENPIVSEEE